MWEASFGDRRYCAKCAKTLRDDRRRKAWAFYTNETDHPRLADRADGHPVCNAFLRKGTHVVGRCSQPLSLPPVYFDERSGAEVLVECGAPLPQGAVRWCGRCRGRVLHNAEERRKRHHQQHSDAAEASKALGELPPPSAKRPRVDSGSADFDAEIQSMLDLIEVAAKAAGAELSASAAAAAAANAATSP